MMLFSNKLAKAANSEDMEYLSIIVDIIGRGVGTLNLCAEEQVWSLCIYAGILVFHFHSFSLGGDDGTM